MNETDMTIRKAKKKFESLLFNDNIDNDEDNSSIQDEDGHERAKIIVSANSIKHDQDNKRFIDDSMKNKIMNQSQNNISYAKSCQKSGSKWRSNSIKDINNNNKSMFTSSSSSNQANSHSGTRSSMIMINDLMSTKKFDDEQSKSRFNVLSWSSLKKFQFVPHHNHSPYSSLKTLSNQEQQQQQQQEESLIDPFEETFSSNLKSTMGIVSKKAGFIKFNEGNTNNRPNNRSERNKTTFQISNISSLINPSSQQQGNRHQALLLTIVSLVVISLISVAPIGHVQAIEQNDSIGGSGSSSSQSSGLSSVQSSSPSVSASILSSLLDSASSKASSSISSSSLSPSTSLSSQPSSSSSASSSLIESGSSGSSGKSPGSSIVASLGSAMASAAVAAATAAAQSSLSTDGRSVRASGSTGHNANGKSSELRGVVASTTSQGSGSANGRSSLKQSSPLNHLAMKLADAIPEVPYNILHNMKKLDHAAPFYGSGALYAGPAYNVVNKIAAAASGGSKKDGGSSLIGTGSSLPIRSSSLGPAAMNLLSSAISAASGSEQFSSLFRSPFWKRLADGYGDFASEFRSFFKPPIKQSGGSTSASGSPLKASKLIRDISVPALLMLVASAMPNEWRPIRTRRKSFLDLPTKLSSSNPEIATTNEPSSSSLLGLTSQMDQPSQAESNQISKGYSSQLNPFQAMSAPNEQQLPFSAALAASISGGHNNNNEGHQQSGHFMVGNSPNPLLMNPLHFSSSSSSQQVPTIMRRMGENIPTSTNDKRPLSGDLDLNAISSAAIATDSSDEELGHYQSDDQTMIARSSNQHNSQSVDILSSSSQPVISQSGSLTSERVSDLKNNNNIHKLTLSPSLDFVGRSEDANPSLFPATPSVGRLEWSNERAPFISFLDRSPLSTFKKRELLTDDKHRYSLVDLTNSETDTLGSFMLPVNSKLNQVPVKSEKRINSGEISNDYNQQHQLHYQPQQQQQHRFSSPSSSQASFQIPQTWPTTSSSSSQKSSKSIPSVLSAVSQAFNQLLFNQLPTFAGHQPKTESGYHSFNQAQEARRFMNLGDNPINHREQASVDSFMRRQPQALALQQSNTNAQTQNGQQQIPATSTSTSTTGTVTSSQDQRDLSQLVPQSWKDAVKRTVTNVQQSATSQWKNIETWYNDKFNKTSSSMNQANPSGGIAPMQMNGQPNQQTNGQTGPVGNFFSGVGSAAVNILGLGQKSNNNNNNNSTINEGQSKQNGAKQALAGMASIIMKPFTSSPKSASTSTVSPPASNMAPFGSDPSGAIYPIHSIMFT